MTTKQRLTIITHMLKNTKILFIFLFFIITGQYIFGQLQWEKTIINHNAGSDDKEYTTSFNFINNGKYPVNILSIKSSCSCTTADPDKKKYGPGESGEIEVTFKFKGKRGHTENIITVLTDDPEVYKQELKLIVEIPDAFKMTPRFLSWRTNEKRDPKQIKILIPDWSDGKIGKVIFDNKLFKYKLQYIGTEKKGEKYILTIIPPSAKKLITIKSRATIFCTEKGKKKSYRFFIYLK